MDLLDFQERWAEIAEKGFYNYDTLSKEERVWFNVEPIITEGVFDHYMNSGAEHNKDTIDDFKTLELNDIADLFVKMNTLFSGKPPADIDERNAIIESWEDGKYDEFIDEIDDKVFERAEEIEKRLIDFIIENKLA